MLDAALRALVEATTEEEAERQLELLLEGIGPLVRKIVARKLSACMPAKIFSSEDLEDVAADTTLVLLRRLQALRAHPGANDIESLHDYAAAVTYSVCAQHLRRRYPERSRLKNRLRYVLERGGRFALWDVPGAGLHCGFATWRGRAADPVAAEKRFSIPGK